MASPARPNFKWRSGQPRAVERSRPFPLLTRSKSISPSANLNILHGGSVFRRRPAAWQADKELRLQLILADGSTYPHEGNFYFADRQVNESTGAIRLAGLFPNPEQYFEAWRLRQSSRGNLGPNTSALLVPQRAVSELQGGYQVAVVDADNKVDVRTVTVGDRVDSRWIIASGLNPGDRVVAEGVQKVRTGVHVNPKPFMATARIGDS